VVNGVRRPTPRELLRLQDFPDSFQINLSYTQMRKQIGNSVTFPLKSLQHLFKTIRSMGSCFMTDELKQEKQALDQCFQHFQEERGYHVLDHLQ